MLKRGKLKRKQCQRVGGGNQYIQASPCPLPCLVHLGRFLGAIADFPRVESRA